MRSQTTMFEGHRAILHFYFFISYGIIYSIACDAPRVRRNYGNRISETRVLCVIVTIEQTVFFQRCAASPCKLRPSHWHVICVVTRDSRLLNLYRQAKWLRPNMLLLIVHLPLTLSPGIFTDIGEISRITY